MNAYRRQQLAIAAAIESGDYDKACDLARQDMRTFSEPEQSAQIGTIRNGPEQKDITYQIGKSISRIIRRLLK